MLFTIPYAQSLGNSAIFFRLMNAGTFWNWTASTWDAVESANTKLWATEYASDATDSNYSVSHTTPVGVFIQEAVLASTGEGIGRDETTINNLGTLAEIEGSTVLAKQTKLDSLYTAMFRMLGLMMENHVEDDIVRNAAGLKTASTFYLYDSKANALTHDKATGLTETYSIAITYDVNGKMTLFKVVHN
jgi:hypothetical protein